MTVSTTSAYDFDRDEEGLLTKLLSKIGKDVLVLLRLAKAVKNADYMLAAPQIAALLATLGYVISPVDAVPDVIPVGGLADDAGMVAIVVATLAVEIAAFREWEREYHSGKYRG